MRRASMLLGVLVAALAAAVFAGSSASRNVTAPEHAWFGVAIQAHQTGDVSEHLRGSIQGGQTALVGYLRVRATVENLGAGSHSGTVVVTVLHPTGELTNVVSATFSLGRADTSEVRRGSTQSTRPNAVTFSATVPCDCPGEHSASITVVPTPGAADAAPATASVLAMMR